MHRTRSILTMGSTLALVSVALGALAPTAAADGDPWRETYCYVDTFVAGVVCDTYSCENKGGDEVDCRHTGRCLITTSAHCNGGLTTAAVAA